MVLGCTGSSATHPSNLCIPAIYFPFTIDPESLISYDIFDKEKSIDKYISKIVKPLLINAACDFKKRNNGKNLSEVSQFKDFKKTLDQIFGSDAQNVDQKLKGLFY